MVSEQRVFVTCLCRSASFVSFDALVLVAYQPTLYTYIRNSLSSIYFHPFEWQLGRRRSEEVRGSAGAGHGKIVPLDTLGTCDTGPPSIMGRYDSSIHATRCVVLQ